MIEIYAHDTNMNINEAHKAVRQTLLFAATGDLMLGDHPVVIGHGVRSLLERKGADFAFAYVKEILTAADITLGNLEVVLADTGLIRRSLESFELRGSPVFVGSLKRAGYDVMSIANNHILQHGEDAFYDTIELLDKEEIRIVGRRINGSSYHSEPAWFNVDKIRTAIFGYSMRPEKYFRTKPLYATGSIEKILEDVQRVRDDANNVIVSLHWGDEYINRPSLDMIRKARALIDGGVDLIIGHHPHVLQGIEEYRNGIIAYSLGNFVFDMWQDMMNESIIFRCTLGTNGIQSYDYVPCFINAQYQPVPLVGEEGDWLRKKIDSLSLALKHEDFSMETAKKRRYEQEVGEILCHYRHECYRHFITNFWKYDPALYIQSLRRAFRRRMQQDSEGEYYD